MIKILLGNINCKIIGDLPRSVLKKLDAEMSYEFPGYQYMIGSGKRKSFGSWDGRFRLLSKSGSFPIGLLSMAELILNNSGVSYSIIDNRKAVGYGKALSISNKKFIPRKYQKKVVEKCLSKGSGIVRVATGGGKTAIIAMLAAKYNVKTVIYVIGIELLHQMKNTIEGLYGIECGMVGGGHCDVSKKITIMTIWSAASAFNKKIKIIDNDLTMDGKRLNQNLKKSKIKDLVSEAKLIIIDECQYAASETVQFLHKSSRDARHRFLFSGTPWRDAGDDILIEAVGGPKIYDINATKLINGKFLVAPEIHFINVPIMPRVGSTYHEVYSNYIVENDDRNNLIVNAAKKMVASGKKVLILVVRVKHGHILMDMIGDSLRCASLDGSNSANDRLSKIGQMKNGELDVLIASKIFDQGVDIPQLDALILAGSGKSSGRALQRIGRVIRAHDGKSNAIVVDFYDNAKYLKSHSQKRIDIYKSEPGFKVKMPNLKNIKFSKPKETNWV